MNLTDLKPGESAKILKIWATGSLKRRLMDMGLVSGADITVEKIAPLGDPIEVYIKQYRLSLRKGEAAKIDVEVLP